MASNPSHRPARDPSRAARRAYSHLLRYRAFLQARTIVSIVSVAHDPQHEGVGHARKALLADQHVEAERAEIVGQRLQRPRALDVEHLGIAVAGLAALGPEIGGPGELAERDPVGAAAVHTARAHV